MLLYVFNYFSKVVASKAKARKDTESYSSVCKKLPKLCPRLVPSPLWGLSLAKLARMEPRIAFVISDDCPALVEKVGDYWMSLDRNGVCEVCGGVGNEIDEDWLYYVFTKKGEPVPGTSRVIRESFRGVAYLRGLRLLCSKCHAAKHQGYALTHGKGSEALEWLQKVNRISSVDEVKRLVEQAFNIHYQLSAIEKWSIRIGRLTWLDNKARKGAEKLLNHMYGSGFRFGGGWLYYLSLVGNKVEQLAKQEAYAILAEVKKKAGGDYKDEIWVRCLEEVVKDRLEAENIYVSEEELTSLVRLLPNRFRNAKHFEQLFVQKSGGKWIAKVPNSMYEKIFRRVLESLEKTGLAYQAKILCEKDSIVDDYPPIIVYAPTSFSPRYISSLAKVLKTVLNEFGLTGKIHYKPDIFTSKAIYSEKGRKASIYSYSY
jgi:hypothetical protein